MIYELDKLIFELHWRIYSRLSTWFYDLLVD